MSDKLRRDRMQALKKDASIVTISTLLLLEAKLAEYDTCFNNLVSRKNSDCRNLASYYVQLGDICAQLNPINLAKALELYTKAYQTRNAIDPKCREDTFAQLDLNIKFGYTYTQTNNIPKAIEHYNQAIKTLTPSRTKDDAVKRQLADTHAALGLIYTTRQRNASEAVSHWLIFPRKNGHIAKQLVFPQTLLDSNSPVSNEDAYDYNTHRYIRTHVF